MGLEGGSVSPFPEKIRKLKLEILHSSSIARILKRKYISFPIPTFSSVTSCIFAVWSGATVLTHGESESDTLQVKHRT